jgi:hypothetical protein
MRQRGVLFTSESRLAIREGRKTQTRRIPASFKEINEHPDEWEAREFHTGGIWFHNKREHYSTLVKIPWAIGDELYIKERVCTVCHDKDGIEDACYFSERNETTPCIKAKWNTSMFMPKWAARDWLRVTAVRCERLQSISEEDAKAEGTQDGFYTRREQIEKSKRVCISGFISGMRAGFSMRWDEINGKKHPWEDNPWDIAYTFERIHFKH